MNNNGGEQLSTNTPTRTSALRRLEEMPTAQELHGGVVQAPIQEETIYVQYGLGEHPDDPPVPLADLLFTAKHSEAIRQQTLPAGEAFDAQDGQWMSAEDLAAYMQRLEMEALAELEAEEAKPGQRSLKVQYKGPDGVVRLSVSEGVHGTKIERLMAALASQDHVQPERPEQPIYAPATPYYSAPRPVAFQPAAPAPAALPAAETPVETPAETLVETVKLRKDKKRAKQNQQLDDEQEKQGFLFRHRRGLATTALASTAFLWYQPVGNMLYETAKQGIKGEIISVGELIQAGRGQEVTNEEKK